MKLFLPISELECPCVSVFLPSDQSLVSFVDVNIEPSGDIVCGRWSYPWISIHLWSINLVLVDEIWVLSLSKAHQVELILLLLIFKSLHSRVHVNGEGYDDVETDNDTKVVKYYEEVAIPQVSTLNVDAHGHDNVPIINHNQDEESDVGGEQVIEVYEVVVVGDGLIVENSLRIFCYLATEYKHTQLRKYIENCQHDERQVVDRTQQILLGLKYDSHHLHFVK